MVYVLTDYCSNYKNAVEKLKLSRNKLKKKIFFQTSNNYPSVMKDFVLCVDVDIYHYTRYLPCLLAPW